MSPSRHQVLQLAAAHDLGDRETRALLALAGLDRPPKFPPRMLRLAFALLAGLLGGLGLVFLVAANWDNFDRFTKFGGLATIVLLTGMAAWLRGGASRSAAALLCFLVGGALLALIGQTYQTGADPWQLFALWAALTLPLAFGTRSDALWSGWAIVACTAIALWLHAWSGPRWFFSDRVPLAPQFVAWGASAAVATLLLPVFASRTGTGPWAFRTAVLLGTVLVAGGALIGLFLSRVSATYPAGLALLVACAWLLAQRRFFDFVALAILVLAIDTLLVCGVGRALIRDDSRDPIFGTLLLALIAAGVLSASVTLLMRLRTAQGGRDD